jgi:predicted RND superfamily exporter protein
MNEKWFFIGSVVGIFSGITLGKIMFDRGDNLPSMKKWEAVDKIEKLEKENKHLRKELNIIIEYNNNLKDSTDTID